MKTKYTIELREKALKLSDEIGNKKAAEELGINVKTLDYWRSVRKRQDDKKKTKQIEQSRLH